jgi:penicillin amidase
MIKKFILGMIGVLFLLLLIIGIFILVQVNQLKPDYCDNFKIKELNKPVKISWDQGGVIHVEGESVADVVLASGYVTAKERLWQMEVMRRAAKGQLSEIFGDTTLNIDKLFLTLSLDSITTRNYLQISADSRDWLNWYSTGINAYLAAVGNDLPIEFILMNFKPSLWSPEDCLLQNRLMAWLLNFNWKADFLYWQLFSMISPEKIREIFPQWNNSLDIIPELHSWRSMQRLVAVSNQLNQIVGPGLGVTGSNSWVVSPQKTANKKAWLANDPHLNLQLPSLWIEMHLKAGVFEAMGFSLPGSPGIIIGRNNSLAWGLTNAMIDDSDLFLEKVDTSKGIYWKDNISYPLGKRECLIKIKDRPDLLYTSYHTENGPLINLFFPEIKATQSVSLKWVGWENSDELNTFIHLSSANSWTAFENCLQTYAVPAQNFVIADREGNIGYRLAGKIPIRSYDNGLLPQPGWDSRNLWKSWIPFNQMPKLFNPPEGFIVTANNRILSDYPYYLSELWEPPYRALRLRELLENNVLLDFQAMKEFQCDNKNLLAEEIWPIILSELDSVPLPNEYSEKVRDILQNWNFSMDRENIAASIFETFQHFLMINIFKDEMGNDIYKLWTDLPTFYLRIFLQVFKNEGSAWFDNINTAELETRSLIFRYSIIESLHWLEDKCGPDLENWRWGRLHQLKLQHSLGQLALTDILFNRGPFSAAGSGCTVNVGIYRHDRLFEMFVGPSLRFLVDWGSPDQYWSILPGGNSGHFLSEYYDNQISTWRNGNLKVVKLDEVKRAKVLNLSPPVQPLGNNL